MHDVFSISTPELGQVVELALSHNDKGIGAAWQIDRVELENMTTGTCTLMSFSRLNYSQLILCVPHLRGEV